MRFLPDSRLFAITKDDSVTFGILQSRIHEAWALELSSSHGVGNDPTYNAESCFETFPFPEGMAIEADPSTYANDPLAVAIANAADTLDAERQNYLHPTSMVAFSPDVDPALPPVRTILPGHEAEMATRTLTDLYNTNPAWLKDDHEALNMAVAAAYGWSWPMSDDDIIKNLFALNAARTKV